MKKIKILLPFTIVGLLIACLNESCKAPVLASSTFAPIYITKDIYIPVLKHDTIKVKSKGMTPEEFQLFLTNQYRYNFDHLFAPEFKRLESIIEMQAKSIDKQSAMYLSSRARYIRYRDSMQIITGMQSRELIDIKKESVKKQQQQIDQNVVQLKGLSRVTNLMLIGGFSIIFICILLALGQYLLWIKIKGLYKKLEHAS